MTDMSHVSDNEAVMAGAKKGLSVFDELDEKEQREFLASLFRAVTAWKQTSDVDRLVAFAKSVDLMVQIGPEARQALRDSTDEPIQPEDLIDLDDVRKLLRE